MRMTGFWIGKKLATSGWLAAWGFLLFSIVAGTAQAQENGTYRIKVKHTGRYLHVNCDAGGDQFASTRFQTNDQFSNFVLNRNDDNTYTIRCQANNLPLHLERGEDQLVATRTNQESDDTKFYLERQDDGTFKIRVKSTQKYLHLNGEGDKLMTAAIQYDDGYSRYFFEKQAEAETNRPPPMREELANQPAVNGENVTSVDVYDGNAVVGKLVVVGDKRWEWQETRPGGQKYPWTEENRTRSSVFLSSNGSFIEINLTRQGLFGSNPQYVTGDQYYLVKNPVAAVRENSPPEQTGTSVALRQSVYMPPPSAIHWYQIQHVQTGRSIDVPGSSNEGNKRLELWPFHGGENQQFRFEAAENGHYFLTSRVNGLAVSLLNAGQSPGTPVIQWRKGGGMNGKYRLKHVSEDKFYLVSSLCDRPLTVRNGQLVLGDKEDPAAEFQLIPHGLIQKPASPLNMAANGQNCNLILAIDDHGDVYGFQHAKSVNSRPIPMGRMARGFHYKQIIPLERDQFLAYDGTDMYWIRMVINEGGILIRRNKEAVGKGWDQWENFFSDRQNDGVLYGIKKSNGYLTSWRYNRLGQSVVNHNENPSDWRSYKRIFHGTGNFLYLVENNNRISQGFYRHIPGTRTMEFPSITTEGHKLPDYRILERSLSGDFYAVDQQNRLLYITAFQNSTPHVIDAGWDYKHVISVSEVGSLSSDREANYWTNKFSTREGWSAAKDIRTAADVDGDGKADLVGFNQDSVVVSYSSGTNFSKPTIALHDFGTLQGWSIDRHPRVMADVNGDKKADIVGFFEEGVAVSLSKGRQGFEEWVLWTPEFSNAAGYEIRTAADVNGDGKADIVAFTVDHVDVAISDGEKFDRSYPYCHEFCSAQGWKNGIDDRILADVDGDKKADIVAFNSEGVYVGYSNGIRFTKPRFLTKCLANHKNYEFRTVGYINKGYISYSVFTGISKDGVLTLTKDRADGFTTHLWSRNFGSDSGWTAEQTRLMADVNGDNYDDLICFGTDGVMVRLCNFSTPDSPIALFEEQYTVPVGTKPEPSQIKFYNEGGYIGRYFLEYKAPNGQLVTYETGNMLFQGPQRQHTVPVGATDIRIWGESCTGLIWDPWYTIFDLKYKYQTDLKNTCFKSYGTSLNPAWNTDCTAWTPQFWGQVKLTNKTDKKIYVSWCTDLKWSAAELATGVITGAILTDTNNWNPNLVRAYALMITTGIPLTSTVKQSFKLISIPINKDETQMIVETDSLATLESLISVVRGTESKEDARGLVIDNIKNNLERDPDFVAGNLEFNPIIAAAGIFGAQTLNLVVFTEEMDKFWIVPTSTQDAWVFENDKVQKAQTNNPSVIDQFGQSFSAFVTRQLEP